MAGPVHEGAPTATYRLQLGGPVGFAAAAELLGYLAALGVSHLYLSPVLRARPGSGHGYDVVRPDQVSPELGGEQGLRALAAAAAEHGLRLLVDIVPNHLGVGSDNPWWERLLAEGADGPAARCFDVDWRPALPGAVGKLILPVLGDQYGRVLERGELRVAVDGDAGEPRLRYHERSFPLSRPSLAELARAGGPAAVADASADPAARARLHDLLEAQHYRLVHWRAGDGLVNYRRFFAINELAAVRVEDEGVFADMHERVLALVADGVVDALRVDHPDGLRDPARYLERLAERCRAARGGRPAWIVTEKILHTAPGEGGEALPEWPVAGTTGYEFCNQVLGLFVDPSADAQLDALDRDFGASPAGYDQQARAAKREILGADLAADARRLARRLWALCQRHPEVRDVDDRDCEEALERTVASLDVYRCYVDPESGRSDAADVARVESAVARARSGHGRAPGFLYDFLADALSGRAGSSPEHLDLIARFQQLSGAATAKGVEDTVFYRYRRLLAVNEVGGDPARLGWSAAEFHDACRRRAADWPASMLTTATHDTKRGEDVRLRIAALSELPADWAAEARAWRGLNRRWVVVTARGPSPDPQTELLLYQTLVGVWRPTAAGPPGDELVGRVHAYLVKAAREAKQRSSWRDPDEAFEDGLRLFVGRLLDQRRSAEFLGRLSRLTARVAEVAVVSGLAQTLLRCTAPGVPDTYQGNELWDDSLVDPDNRRPVDFGRRRELLAALDGDADPAALLAARGDGRVKLWVLSRALRARRELPACLGPAGGYLPLRVSGSLAAHVVAFARTAADGGSCALTVVPRLPGRVMGASMAPPLADAWGDTRVHLPAGPARLAWSDRLSGTAHRPGASLGVSALLSTLPVALLVGRAG